jgi:alpha-2-macroglobulin
VMVDELARLVDRGGPALLSEGKADLGWYWSSDGRTTALALSALLEARPQHPAVQQLADGLLRARVDGQWASTQENLYSLLALAQLARARTDGEVSATVSLGGKVIGRQALKGHTAHFRVPLAQLGAGPLVITGQGGPLFYAARVRVERPLETPPGPDRGLSVERSYTDPETGKTLTRLKVGQVAKVKVRVNAAQGLSHVAVVDRLPAGVEPVLTRFSPTLKAEAPARRRWWMEPQTVWQHQELHDDRAALFADVLAPGLSEHEYLVRAVAAGTFAAPPATAEAMYRPQVRGQSTAATLVVLP